MVNEKPQQPEQEEGENKVTPEKDSTQRNVEKKTEETKTKIEKQAKNVGNLPKEVKNEATDGENEELEDNKGKIGDIAQQAKESLESLGFIDIEPQEIFDSLEDKDIDELKGLMEGEPEIAKIERDLEGLSRELKDLESFNPRNKDKRRKNEKNKEAKQKEIDELKKKLDQAKEAVNETAKLNFWFCKRHGKKHCYNGRNICRSWCSYGSFRDSYWSRGWTFGCVSWSCWCKVFDEKVSKKGRTSRENFKNNKEREKTTR